MSYSLWDKTELANIFEAIVGLADAGGLWSAEVATIVAHLCQALDIQPKLPEVQASAIRVTNIQPPMLTGPKSDSAVIIVEAEVEKVDL